jgi:pimeloyl-ACP methyl ester carboxylesterase
VVREELIDVRGHATTVRRGGHGPPLLWLHGEGVSSDWRDVHDRLAERFTVWAPVLPGFGGGELPAWLDGPDDVALHLVDLCAAVGLDRVVVAGESLGGWIAATLAIWRPSLVGGLALVGTLGLRSAEPMPDLFIRSGPEAMRYLAASVDGAAVDPLTGDVELATALWVEQAAQARLMWERPYDPTLPRRAHHVTCPVRVVWGAADRLLAPSHATAVAELFGAPPATIVPGAGHLVSVDAPEAVASAVTEAFA